MSKKRNKRSARNKASPAALPSTALESSAREALQRGRYRDAIAHFKLLLKREPQATWHEGLAQAYEGRARNLIEKGMLKEALVMWENRHRLGDVAPLRRDHIALLLRLGRVREALELFNQAAGTLPPDALAALRAQLAACYLSGETEILERLAPEDPVVVHGEAAQAALAAYCSGDDAALEQALAVIPFRSPYRDGVQIFKALQHLAEQPDQALALLARVPAESAFAPLHQAVELALAPEQELTSRLADAGEITRRFALTLRGWPPERQALFDEARRLGDEPPPKALLQFLYRHRGRLGDAWVQERGRRLLIDAAPQSLEWPREAGGRPLSKAEMVQVGAWQAERQRGDPWYTLQCWELLAQHLESNHSPAPGSDQALRIALVLRRFDQQSDLLAYTTPSPEPDALDRAAAHLVERSLDYDPDAPQVYLRLIAYHLRGKELKAARRLLEPALARWPDDTQVLTAALDTAVAGGAFKKAAGFARRILALDPINKTARERLVKAHLAHARKQICNARPDLARQELERAGAWDQHGRFRTRRDIVEGLTTLATDAQAGASALRAANQRLGDGFTGRLIIGLEAAAVGRTPKALFADLGLSKPRTPDREDLMACLAQLREHLDSGARLPPQVATYFETALKGAARLEFSFQEFESACETLRRCHWETPRQAFAQAALKRWKDAPVFAWHAFEAKYQGAPWQASTTDVRRLERALEQAREQGDMRSVQRLLEVLEPLMMPFEPPPLPPGLEQELGPDALPMLIDLVGLDKLLDMLGLSREMKRQLKEVERQVGRQALVELLGAMIGGEPDALLPFPSPEGRAEGRRHRAQDDRSSDDDAPLNQLDLFP
ncbi:MAG: hypothetical protein U9Q35_02650 [Pseudomonadota bacterium]|nr:hypothetical protein [Pseudomonadota bacterium]